MNTTLVDQADAVLNTALINVDITTLERLLTPDYSFISLINVRIAKLEYLQTLAIKERVLIEKTWISKFQQVYEQAAFCQGLMNIKAEFKGAAFGGEVWVSRNWINDNGFWKLATMHVSDARLQSAWRKLRDPVPKA